jgi:hypothetical protein
MHTAHLPVATIDMLANLSVTGARQAMRSSRPSRSQGLSTDTPSTRVCVPRPHVTLRAVSS